MNSKFRMGKRAGRKKNIICLFCLHKIISHIRPWAWACHLRMSMRDTFFFLRMSMEKWIKRKLFYAKLDKNCCLLLRTLRWRRQLFLFSTTKNKEKETKWVNICHFSRCIWSSTRSLCCVLCSALARTSHSPFVNLMRARYSSIAKCLPNDLEKFYFEVEYRRREKKNKK